MILEDDKGNIFNVEAVIEYEDNPEELKLLCKALYKRLNEVEEEFDMAIECIENSGVNWSEIREGMEDQV